MDSNNFSVSNSGATFSGPISRIKNAALDTIPTTNKPPRRQRSSRFRISERPQLEELPSLKSVPQEERNELFLRKLDQCCVLFDFTDAMSDLKSKEIKRTVLTELVEYITTIRNAISENMYHEIIRMVIFDREILSSFISHSLVYNQRVSTYSSSAQSFWRCIRP